MAKVGMVRAATGYASVDSLNDDVAARIGDERPGRLFPAADYARTTNYRSQRRAALEH